MGTVWLARPGPEALSMDQLISAAGALVDKNGHRFQKVYRLDDTIVHPLGTVEGWESDAMPAGRGRTPGARRGRG